MRLGRVVFVALLLYLVPVWRVFAQAPTGYTKIASTNGLSEIDTAVAAGQVFNYTITAVNAAGESGPSNIVTAVIPTTAGAHSVALSWTASIVDASHGAATSYNVYRELVVLPNPPIASPPVVQ